MKVSIAWRRWIVGLSIALASVVPAANATACSWIERPFSEHWADADEVALVRILETAVELDDPYPRQRIRYEVIEWLKGAGRRTDTATTAIFFWCSGLSYLPGRVYVLFVGGADRALDDRMSRVLSDDPNRREEQLAPYRSMAANPDDGGVAPPSGGELGGREETERACKDTATHVAGEFVFYPTLRRAYEDATRVLRARIVSQSAENDHVAVTIDVIEAYKGLDDGTLLRAPLLVEGGRLESCFVALNGWEYVLFVRGTDGTIDGRHSFVIGPSGLGLEEDLFGASNHLDVLRTLATRQP